MSRNIHGRLERLEGQIPPSVDEAAALRQAVIRDIMNEFGRLRASRARGFRGGVPIEPEDIPGKILGPTYTTGQMMELAVRRVFERADVADEGLIEGWTRTFEKLFARQGQDWNKLEKGA